MSVFGPVSAPFAGDTGYARPPASSYARLVDMLWNGADDDVILGFLRDARDLAMPVGAASFIEPLDIDNLSYETCAPLTLAVARRRSWHVIDALLRKPELDGRHGTCALYMALLVGEDSVAAALTHGVVGGVAQLLNVGPVSTPEDVWALSYRLPSVLVVTRLSHCLAYLDLILSRVVERVPRPVAAMVLVATLVWAVYANADGAIPSIMRVIKSQGLPHCLYTDELAWLLEFLVVNGRRQTLRVLDCVVGTVQVRPRLAELAFQFDAHLFIDEHRSAPAIVALRAANAIPGAYKRGSIDAVKYQFSGCVPFNAPQPVIVLDTEPPCPAPL
jgi:hypothetical protein